MPCQTLVEYQAKFVKNKRHEFRSLFVNHLIISLTAQQCRASLNLAGHYTSLKFNFFVFPPILVSLHVMRTVGTSNRRNSMSIACTTYVSGVIKGFFRKDKTYIVVGVICPP